MRRSKFISWLAPAVAVMTLVACENPQFQILFSTIEIEVADANFSGPLLEVYYGAARVHDGDTLTLFSGQSAASQPGEEFRILNAGNETLTLGEIHINAATNSEYFELIQPDPMVLGQGAESTFSVVLNEDSPIDRSALVLVSSDVQGNDVFRIHIEVGGGSSMLRTRISSGAGHALAGGLQR